MPLDVEGAFVALIMQSRSVYIGRYGGVEVLNVRRKGDQMRYAPDMLEPSFLSVGSIILSSTRSCSKIRCICAGGVDVLGLLGAKRSLYVDKALSAALGSFLVLISFFRSFTYVFSMALSFSLTDSWGSTSWSGLAMENA